MVNKLDENATCCCKKQLLKANTSFNTKAYLLKIFIISILWWLVYSSLISFSQWVTYDLLGLISQTKLADTLEFFIYDTLKILMLLAAMVYVIAWIRSSLSIEMIRSFLLGRNRIFGYTLGSGFGAITPFCSCSSIPLFIGFTAAGIPIGTTIAFLITSPLINEIAIVILWGLLGWKFTIIYVITGMFAGVIGGFFMDHIKAERWLQPYLVNKIVITTEEISETATSKKSISDRHEFAFSEMCEIFKRVWIWVFVGVGFGAALHGYVPEELVRDTLGQGQWWSIPLIVIIGIPLYSSVTGIIPIMESLLLKGLPIGTTLAFCMSTVAISLPEILMLRQVMQTKLLFTFIGFMLVIFTLIGWLFNALNISIL